MYTHNSTFQKKGNQFSLPVLSDPAFIRFPLILNFEPLLKNKNHRIYRLTIMKPIHKKGQQKGKFEPWNSRIKSCAGICKKIHGRGCNICFMHLIC